jgi:hypothetical protein
MPTWRARVRRHIGGVHPWAVWVCVLSLVSGIPLLFGDPPPDSIAATLPPWGQLAWGLLLTLGSATVLAAMVWPGTDSDALAIELVGMLAVGIGTIVYATAILTAASTPAPRTGIAIIAGFGVSCLWRVWVIERTLRTMARLTARIEARRAADRQRRAQP